MVAVAVILGAALVLCLVALGIAFLSRRDYQSQAQFWRNEYLSYNANLGLFAFENYDLIPEWERTNPLISNMTTRQRYSEWLTYCANVVDRDQLVEQIRNGE